MNRLLFVRHGQTEMNVAGLVSGQTETSLTAEGVKQAKATGRQLAANFPKLDLIICSPYERTFDTAKYIAEEIGYPMGDIRKSDMLIERSFGALEGTPGKEFFKTHEYPEMDDVAGAETIQDLDKRAARALQYLQGLEEENILVVGHGSFGRALRRVVNKLPHTHEYEVNTTIGNAAIVELV